MPNNDVRTGEEERYVVIHMETIKALRGLMDLADDYPHLMPLMRQVLRVASTDPQGRIMIGIHVVRDLNEGQQ